MHWHITCITCVALVLHFSLTAPSDVLWDAKTGVLNEENIQEIQKFERLAVISFEFDSIVLTDLILILIFEMISKGF